MRMDWEQTKAKMEGAAKANRKVAISPHTVLALMEQVEDQELLIRKFNLAVINWMSATDENWPTLLNELVEIQDKIKELGLGFN